jgi:parvulin-like peptidyl-prolyl isomerase
MNMTRFVTILRLVVFAALVLPAAVFGKGNSDSPSKDSGGQTVPAAMPGSGETEVPMEISLGDPEVATVQLAPNIPKETIFLGQLKTEIARMEKGQGRPLSPEEKREILDVMINEKLALQAATRDKITVPEAEITKYLQDLKNSLTPALGRQPTDIEFAEAIRRQFGIDAPARYQTPEEKSKYIIDTYREQTRRQGIVQMYLTTKKKTLFESIKIPTEEEISGEYNLEKTKLVRPETVRFTMIQILYEPDKAKARELADRLIRDIGSNASRFDEAVQKGQAAGSGYQAGDAGYLPHDREAMQVVGQEFMDTAFRLKQGEISKLLEGKRGYQIIKITETFPQKNLALDDIFQLGTRMTVRDYIGNVLLQSRQQTALAQASRELITELRTGNTFQVFEKNLKW